MRHLFLTLSLPMLLLSLGSAGPSQPKAQNFKGKATYSFNIEAQSMIKSMFMKKAKGKYPSKQDVYYKGSDIAIWNHGVNEDQPGHFLVKGKKEKAYQLYPQKKSGGEIALSEVKDSVELTKAKKVSDKLHDIAGHKCHKYFASGTANGYNVQYFIYADPDYDVEVSETAQYVLSSMPYFFQGVKGLPIKTETKMNLKGYKINIVYNLMDLQEDEIDKEKFSLKDYNL